MLLPVTLKVSVHTAMKLTLMVVESLSVLGMIAVWFCALACMQGSLAWMGKVACLGGFKWGDSACLVLLSRCT